MQSALRYGGFAMQSEREAGGMQIGEAQRTLLEVDRVRRDTRRDLHPTWFANLVLGLFFAGATVCSLVAPSATLPTVWWAVGLPLSLGLIVWHEARREQALGAEAPLADPALLVVGLITAGVLLVNGATDSDVAWGYVVAAGWLGLAAIYRDALLLIAGVALAVIATGAIAVGPEDAWAWVQLPMALMLIAIGLVGRAWDRP
jgi:hypothetical protein